MLVVRFSASSYCWIAQLEPEAFCWAIEHVDVVGVVGQLDGPATRDVRVDAVVACIDADTWLADATGDEAQGDDRTRAQVAVGQVEFADALLVRGMADLDSWQQSRLSEVLAHMTPRAPVFGAGNNIEELILAVPNDARRRRYCIASHHSRKPAELYWSNSARTGPSIPADCGSRVPTRGWQR